MCICIAAANEGRRTDERIYVLLTMEPTQLQQILLHRGDGKPARERFAIVVTRVGYGSEAAGSIRAGGGRPDMRQDRIKRLSSPSHDSDAVPFWMPPVRGYLGQEHKPSAIGRGKLITGWPVMRDLFEVHATVGGGDKRLVHDSWSPGTPYCPRRLT